MNIRLIEVPVDYGANRRGVDMGPSALRQAGIKQAIQALGHAVEEEPNRIELPIFEHADPGNPRFKFLIPIVRACSELARRVERAVETGRFPLVVGGDHSIAVGTLAGLANAYKKSNTTWGVVWIDAHADFNSPETSPSGNVHGMGLAASVGLGCPELTTLGGDFAKVLPSDLALVGVRDLDPGERVNLVERGVRSFTMAEIDERGMATVARTILEDTLAHVDAIHVSFDVDSLDPDVAPGVGTPVQGGITYRELHLLMEFLARSGKVRSAEVVEINPILDVRNQTAIVATQMVASLLGRTIL